MHVFSSVRHEAQTRYFAFSDACIRWTECGRGERLAGDQEHAWMLFHGARESSDDWLDALSEPPPRRLHLVDFPGYGGSWTCGGRDWGVHEWSLLMRAAIARLIEGSAAGSIAIVAHEITSLPLGMALLTEPRLQHAVRFIALLDHGPWRHKPGRREASRVFRDSWPGVFELREWSRGLAELQLPVLALSTGSQAEAAAAAEQLASAFPRAEHWFKEGARLDEVVQRILDYSEKLKGAKVA